MVPPVEVEGGNVELVADTASHRPVDDEERERMRVEYGRARTHFKLRPDAYRDLRRWLTQGRFAVTYDEYLAVSLRYALVAALVGSLLGVLVAAQLASAGVLAGIRDPLGVGQVSAVVAANRVAFAAVGLGLVGGGLTAAAVWYGRYYSPAYRVSARRAAIEATLPHGIVYLYAMMQGGTNLLGALRALADAEETYGELSRELETVVTDVDLFGNDLYTAVANTRNLTPSESLEGFLDDMLSVLDTGADVVVFLEDATETYLRDAEENQEDFLETLAIMAEVFVVGFVAAPLFLIVTLVVVSLIGGNTVTELSALVYLVLPLSMAAFLVLIETLSEPYKVPAPARDPIARPDVDADVAADARFLPYRRRNARLAYRALLDDPVGTLREHPGYTLAFGGPAAGFLLGLFVATGYVEPSIATVLAEPVRTTVLLAVVPFLLVTVPYTVFHELRRLRQAELSRRFPDTLNVLSSANKMGIPLAEGLGLVARWGEGPLAAEVRTVKNDIEWNHDTTGALAAFGNRLRVPGLARTTRLLADGLRASGDLTRVLAVAADDTRNRERLERARRRELASYVAVVAIGFLVYLLVVLVLDAAYLAPIAEAASGSGAGEDVPLSLAAVPVNVYRAVFFHSALIQAVGCGLLAGSLANDDPLSGLKWSIGLVAVAVLAFSLV